MKNLFTEFFKTEKASGIVLIGCTAVSIILANSPLATSYLSAWEVSVFGKPLSYWINDGLMTLFFLLVGLEIEREIYIGELSQPRYALLPIMAALGGMIVPALFHFGFNAGTETQAGIGIPMATDIAFSLGVLSLLGGRVPAALKVFLTAFAIIDDLGAIIIIALFYTSSFSLANFLIALLITAILVVANRLRVQSLIFYLVSGIVLWHFIHESGIHSTIAGVILALVVPFGQGDKTSPSYKLQHGLHYVVAFFVLPLFALANTALPMREDWYTTLLHPNSVGIMLGLLVGKFLGITLFAFLAVRMNLCSLPTDVKWKHIGAVSLLGGIGFTMSIFIALLAFQDPSLIAQSKTAILLASILAGVGGFLALRAASKVSTIPVSQR